MSNCFICQSPHESARVPVYHDECLNCVYCGNPISWESALLQYEKELKSSPSGNLLDYKLILYHEPCHDRKLREDFEKRPLTITQGHLDLINKYLAMTGFSASATAITPLLDINLNVETNQQAGELAVHQAMISLNLEEKFLLIKTLQGVAAMASIVGHRDPKMKDVVLEISQRDRKRFEQVQKQREDMGRDQQTKAVESQAKAAKQIQRQEEKQDASGILTARRKSIESLMKIGMTQFAAEAVLDSQKGKSA